MSRPEFEFSSKPRRTYSRPKAKPQETFSQMLNENESMFLDLIAFDDLQASSSGKFSTIFRNDPIILISILFIFRLQKAEIR